MYPDPKWRSVFGTIERGKKFTVFSLSVRLKNGCVIFQKFHATNAELDDSKVAYKLILNQLVKELDKRLAERV